MEYETITVSPLTPHIGAEIGNIDLRLPLTNVQVHDLHEALMAHSVIFFRDQPIDIPTQIALGTRFGRLHHHTGMGAYSRDFPEVTQIYADENSDHVNGEEWHTDLSCDPVPPMGSILHIHTLPPSGGDTVFASMYAVFEALSAPMKKYLENLTATHDGTFAFSKYGSDRKFPRSVHPIVVRHPVTARKLLFVNKGFTTHINELPADESAAVLAYLYAHIAKPEFQCRFRWRAHSIAFWDNRCTQHIAIWDYFPNKREGFRIQIDADHAIVS